MSARRARSRRDPRPRRTWGQRAVLALCSTIVVALLGSAAALGYTYRKYSRLGRVQLGAVLSEEVASSDPQNILLVGVDSAGALDPDDPVAQGRAGGLRSDTMMVLRVEPDAEQAHLLSIPRDLWVPLASGGSQRINTAIQQGGAPELIDTIEGYFGIPIHHYVQVDFAAFRELVEVIGGVPVWFDAPARDRKSLLDVPTAGCVTLTPEQALAFVRSRTYEEQQPNGRWRTDPTGDHGRMRRQQEFIISALRRAVTRGARNPVVLDRLLDAVLGAVTVDDQWRAEGIASLALQFRLFEPERLQRHVLPVVDDRVGQAEILRLVASEAEPILRIFRGVGSAELTPADVRVEVRNGTGLPGQARTVSDALAEVGFTTVGTGEAERFDVARTTVRYVAGAEAAADLVARHLEPTAVLEEVSGPLSADVVVVTGADLTGVREVPTAPTTTIAVPSTTTTTAPVTTTTAGTSGTATTAPEDPGRGSC